MADSVLIVVAKYWEPGRVKTRLQPQFSPAAATELHRRFLQTTLARLQSVAARHVIAYTPADRRNEFAALAGDAWELCCQAAGDLGERLADQFERAAEQGARRIAAVGADSPDLPVAYVEQAFELLKTQDAVLGPATDGGYYLLGAARPLPSLAGIAWSTAAALRQTVDALTTAGLSVGMLPPWSDVDTPADVAALRRRLSRITDDPQLTALAAALDNPA